MKIQRLQSFLAANPGASFAQVADGLGIDVHKVCALLADCVKRGRLFRCGLYRSYRYFATQAEASEAAPRIEAEQAAERKAKEDARQQRRNAAHRLARKTRADRLVSDADKARNTAERRKHTKAHALECCVQQNPGATVYDLSEKLGWPLDAVRSNICDWIGRTVFAAGPKQLRRFYATPELAQSLGAEYMAQVEAERRAKNSVRHRAKRAKKRAARIAAGWSPKPKMTPEERAEKERERKREARQRAAQKRPQLTPEQQQERRDAINARRREASAKKAAQKPPKAPKSEPEGPVVRVVKKTRRDFVSAEPIIPPHVKVQVLPSQPGRFEVVGPFDRAITADWMSRRQAA